MTRLMRSCAECGTPSASTWCDEHAPKHYRGPRPADQTADARGYDWAWRKLSKAARRAQPWCSDCGTTLDLTTDHLPSAWERKARGLPLRVEDVEVVCRGCNARRGSSRAGSDRAAAASPAERPTLGGGGRPASLPSPPPVAKLPSLTAPPRASRRRRGASWC